MSERILKAPLICSQQLRQHEVDLVVHTSTSEVYGSARYTPIDEKHPLQGQSPYSASKIGADKMVEAFNLSFGLPTVTIRPFNTFGPRQSLRAIIPTIITQCFQDQVISLGNIHPTRDFNFVANTVNGFMLAIKNPEAIGQTINLGSGSEINIGDLATLIAQMMGKSVSITEGEERKRPAGSEVDRLLASNDKARELLGWKPEVDLQNGLIQTIAWVESNIGSIQRNGYII